MKKLFNFEFLPTSADFALLTLRLWLGISMLWLHGAGKFMNLLNGSSKFSDPLGIGQTPSLILAVFAEAVCALLLALGLFTRLAAFALAVTMGVAFFISHKGVLSGQGNGELAFIYLAGYVAIFFAGAGRFSIDGGKGSSSSSSKPKKSSE
ncbi:DoxX family protein [Oleiharenicola lentus]|uniref:DoxX family protein n=1 Tax=Oleiharenicola lentus TaxID=2508720 RepID=UPI003F664EFA